MWHSRWLFCGGGGGGGKAWWWVASAFPPRGPTPARTGRKERERERAAGKVGRGGPRGGPRETREGLCRAAPPVKVTPKWWPPSPATRGARRGTDTARRKAVLCCAVRWCGAVCWGTLGKAGQRGQGLVAGGSAWAGKGRSHGRAAPRTRTHTRKEGVGGRAVGGWVGWWWWWWCVCVEERGGKERKREGDSAPPLCFLYH